MARYSMKPAIFLLLIIVAMSLASAIPKPDEEHTNRILKRELSDQDHYGEGDSHNSEYDHEAFLGRDDAKTFDQLTPEESQQRLGIIYDKIDRNQDGFVTEEELREWIKHVQHRYVWSDTDRQWADQDTEEGNTVLPWIAYKKRTYGFLDDAEEEEDPEGYTYADMIKRDEKRWRFADENNDGKLTKAEYANFLHPEEAEHMRDIVIEETLEDIDKNKDGKISIDEYIGDMWPGGADGLEEPDWVKVEREQFHSFRDKNKDGMMDSEEVRDWIMPPDYDHSEAEAKHLLYESDLDRDSKLTREEVLNKYDLFVGSQATDFGEALTKHDEF